MDYFVTLRDCLRRVHGLVRKALEDAGVKQRFRGLSAKLRSHWVGPERITVLERITGSGWPGGCEGSDYGHLHLQCLEIRVHHMSVRVISV